MVYLFFSIIIQLFFLSKYKYMTASSKTVVNNMSKLNRDADSHTEININSDTQVSDQILPLQQKLFINTLICIQIINITILIAIIGFSWISFNNQSSIFQIGNILASVGLILSVFIMALLFHGKADQHGVNRCTLLVLMVVVIPLVFTSGVLIIMNIPKPNICPDYTNSVNLSVYGSLQTACVCIDSDQFQYTVLGVNTFGYLCCDCPLTTSCLKNGDSCSIFTPKSSIIGILLISVGVSQIFLLIWAFI